jgi:hypothetical protein
MSQTQEVNPVESTGVYPQPTPVENRVRVEDIPKRPPYVRFTDGGEDVRVPQKEAKRNVQPDAIGTVTIATVSFGLMGGIPFGVPGAVVGAVFGFAVGFINQRGKLKKRTA